jgi:hypothetical protein
VSRYINPVLHILSAISSTDEHDTSEMEQQQPQINGGEDSNLDQPDSAEQDNSDQDGDDEYDGQYIEQWRPTVEAISAAILAAFPGSPRDPSPESSPDPNRNPEDNNNHDEFRRYWHDVFTQLLSSVVADPTIPEQLTQPPTESFHVNIFDHPHGMCCPCMMPDVEPSIELEREGGVRKTNLVRGVRDFLYGDAAAASPVEVYRCDAEFNGDEVEVMETPLLYTWDWMSAGRGEDGERVSYYYVGHAPQVFLYVCPVGEYEEKQKLAGRAGAGDGDGDGDGERDGA